MITLVLILILSFQTEIHGRVDQSYHLLQVLPYVLVLIGGIIGINVFVVLLTGIASGALIMLLGGHTTPTDLLTNMGSGVSGMFETCMVAILVAAMCALIRNMADLMRCSAGSTGSLKENAAGSWVWDC